jgi:DNA-binding CsgD family transcriptional regulator
MADAVVDRAAPRAAGTHLPLLVVDDDCVCVQASLGACRLLGASRDRVIGSRLADLLEPGSHDRLEYVWRAFRSGGGHAGPFTVDSCEAPAGELSVWVTPSVLPSRHLVVLEPAAIGARPATGMNRVEDVAALRPRRRPTGPTPRECQVLDLLAEGATDEQIAGQLDLSPATVQTHVRNAKAKLGARTRAQAVALALRRGLISAP